MTKKYAKSKLKEHRQFRNQLIFFTLLFIGIGVYLLYIKESEGSVTFFGYGAILGLLAIYNIFIYRENKKDFKKLYG